MDKVLLLRQKPSINYDTIYPIATKRVKQRKQTNEKIGHELPSYTNLEWVICQSKYNRLSLVMRANFMGFYSSVGLYYPLLDELEQRNLPPPALIGVSCGAIAAWLLGSGLSRTTVLTMLGSLERSHIFESPSVAGSVWHYLRHGYFSSGVNAAKKLQDFISTYGAKARLEECSPPVTVVVTTMNEPIPSHWQQLLTNIQKLFKILFWGYKIWPETSNHEVHAIKTGDAKAAVLASACMPLLFPPVLPLEQMRQPQNRRNCLDGGWGDPIGVTGFPQDPKEAVLVTHVDVKLSMWDKPPFSYILGVPQKPIPERENINLFQACGIPKIDEVNDVLLRGDFSARDEIIEKSGQQMRGWLYSPYESKTADDMNKICLSELNIELHAKTSGRKHE